MKYEIRLKQDVMRKMKLIMKHVKEINNDNEIGAWLTGEWKIVEKSTDKKEVNEKVGVLILDEMIIPKQKVHRTEVDIGPETMIDLIQKRGVEVTNRIKAHWHIHPFGTGKTDWSSIDEEKISSFMDPEKQRKVFVFLLSSYDWMKARVEMNVSMKNPVSGSEENVKVKYDDIDVLDEQEAMMDEKMLEEIKAEIKENVEESVVYRTKYKSSYKVYDSDDEFKSKKEDKEWYEAIDDYEDYWREEDDVKHRGVYQAVVDEDHYLIDVDDNRINIYLSRGFHEYLESSDMISGDLRSYDSVSARGTMIVLTYQLKTDDEKEVKKCMSMLDDAFSRGLSEYIEALMSSEEYCENL